MNNKNVKAHRYNIEQIRMPSIYIIFLINIK